METVVYLSEMQPTHMKFGFTLWPNSIVVKGAFKFFITNNKHWKNVKVIARVRGRTIIILMSKNFNITANKSIDQYQYRYQYQTEKYVFSFVSVYLLYSCSLSQRSYNHGFCLKCTRCCIPGVPPLNTLSGLFRGKIGIAKALAKLWKTKKSGEWEKLMWAFVIF